MPAGPQPISPQVCWTRPLPAALLKSEPAPPPCRCNNRLKARFWTRYDTLVVHSEVCPNTGDCCLRIYLSDRPGCRESRGCGYLLPSHKRREASPDDHSGYLLSGSEVVCCTCYVRTGPCGIQCWAGESFCSPTATTTRRVRSQSSLTGDGLISEEHH